MSLIIYGIILAHFNAYKDYYGRIGLTFAMTFLVKRLAKSANQIEHSELIGLGGYSLTVGEFAKLIQALKQSGIQGSNVEESSKILGGLLGKGIDLLGDLITNK